MELIAVDPGERHCGVATWNDQPTDPHCFTWEPAELFGHIEQWLNVWKPTVVVESFHLYPWLMDQQAYSDLKTVETIGVVRYLCGKFGAQLVEQNATIKKPTFAQLSARGIQLVGKNQHEKDAEAHGWHYILRGT